VVTITSLSTGATASCTVNDRGPYAEGMIIDLAKDVFTKLAPLSQGVIQVRINW
jgi:rare lipoprotein A (peptidoglycan hydrolase)